MLAHLSPILRSVSGLPQPPPTYGEPGLGAQVSLGSWPHSPWHRAPITSPITAIADGEEASSPCCSTSSPGPEPPNGNEHSTPLLSGVGLHIIARWHLSPLREAAVGQQVIKCSDEGPGDFTCPGQPNNNCED